MPVAKFTSNLWNYRSQDGDGPFMVTTGRQSRCQENSNRNFVLATRRNNLLVSKNRFQ